jgi:hypothetical protein
MKTALKISIYIISIMLLLSTGALAFGTKATPAEYGQDLLPFANVDSVAKWDVPGVPYYLVPGIGGANVRISWWDGCAPGAQVWPPAPDMFASLTNFIYPSVVFLDNTVANTYTPADPIYLAIDANKHILATGDLRLSAPLAGTKIVDSAPDINRAYQMAPPYWYFGYVDLDSSGTFTLGDRVYLHTYAFSNKVVNGDLRISP